MSGIITVQKKHRKTNLTMLSHRADKDFDNPEPNLLDSHLIIIKPQKIAIIIISIFGSHLATHKGRFVFLVGVADFLGINACGAFLTISLHYVCKIYSLSNLQSIDCVIQNHKPIPQK